MFDKPDISFFPPPISGETVYSWVSRFHLLSGHRSFREYTLKLFGLNAGRPSNEFPSFLPALAVHSGVDLEWIINQMTSVHYYKPFIAQRVFEQLWESLESGSTENVQTRISSIANRITPGAYLYSCNGCIRDDIKLFGFPFWHIEHQLPGVIACPDHHQHLIGNSRGTVQAKFPEFTEGVGSTATEDQLSHLITDEFKADSGHFSYSFLKKTYTLRLHEMGLLTNNRRVRICQLKKLIKHNVSPLVNTPSVYSWFLYALDLGRYPECLFYKEAPNLHPLKHIVMISTLFESWKQFIDAYHRITVNPEWPDVPQTIQKLHTNLVLSKSAKERLINGESLRTVSVSEGMSVTSLKILAQEAGVLIDLRPSKIFPSMERSIWRLLFLGKKTQEIASLFGVSVGAVEQILRKHQYLKPLRKRIWFYGRRNDYRQQVETFIDQQPNTSRKQIKQSNYAAFMWLYRYDRSWLYEQLPDRLPSIWYCPHSSR